MNVFIQGLQISKALSKRREYASGTGRHTARCVTIFGSHRVHPNNASLGAPSLKLEASGEHHASFKFQQASRTAQLAQWYRDPLCRRISMQLQLGLWAKEAARKAMFAGATVRLPPRQVARIRISVRLLGSWVL
jgi:hypothetical protein